MNLPKRGAINNPRNRFERLAVELDDEFAEEARNPEPNSCATTRKP